MHKKIPRAWVKQMKKYFFMLIALVAMSAVLVSCEEPNRPSNPHETYYDAPARR